MHWIDWLIVLVPLVVVIVIAIKAQKYVTGVADFLSAGRVAGRYVVAVAGAEASMGLVSLVAIFEMYYNSGFAVSFWRGIAMPLGLIMTLMGYCTYRFRETRAMTMGQFLEIRYSRKFRIMAATLQSISGILNYAIFPAVGARFLIYFCDLPLHVTLGGMVFPTFGLVMAIFLSLAVLIISLGGQVTIMVTDCIQGILSYPMYLIVVIFVIFTFSWSGEVEPALLNSDPGKSLLNPFDIDKLRTFNLFYIFVGIISRIFNRMSWSGTQGYTTAALNAHEQKMGGVLGTWRGGFSNMMYVLLAVAGFTFLTHINFKQRADVCRQELAAKVIDDVLPKESVALKKELHSYIETGVISESLSAAIATPASNDAKETLRDNVKQAIQSEDPAAASNFTTIFNQMRVPVALKAIFPIGITGIFCALCIFLLISTDTTYMHSWGSIIVQDLILPIRGKPLTPRQQIRALRLIIASIAVFAFLFSFYFSQIDFILMFFAITGAIWIGGSGPCIVGGLYWKRGTTAGAFSALIAGSSIATGGIILQRLWPNNIYPWIVSHGHVESFGRLLEKLSGPFEPYIVWRMNAERLPINSQEIFFISMVTGISLYVVVSLLTCKKAFNMDRLLHRGEYQREGEQFIKEKFTFRKLLGITSQYTKGDKAIAWSVFLYSFVYGFGSFIVLCTWQAISPLSEHGWANWFLINCVFVPGIVAIVSTVWFSIGGTMDLRRLFQRLAEKNDNLLDDGRVVGHVSADDVALVEKVEHVVIEEAHIEEQELEESLKKEGDIEDLEELKKQLGEED